VVGSKAKMASVGRPSPRLKMAEAARLRGMSCALMTWSPRGHGGTGSEGSSATKLW
jgi:hypothetical protein